MTSHVAALAAGAILVAGGLISGAPADAAAPRGAVPGLPPALSVVVDKPIIHLGETVRLSGRRFTPGATVRIYLHGPFSASLGRLYTRGVVDHQGAFVLSVAVAGYPDALARQWRTIDIAVVSSAVVNGVREGAMAPIQVDPTPSTEITTHAALRWTTLSIDGVMVKAQAEARNVTYYRVSYAGHLRAGPHSAYLKWGDASGYTGARSWSFRIGSPTAVPVAPRLNLNKNRIRLGESVLVAGQGFTPEAMVTISLGGPNTSPRAAGQAVADSLGIFHARVRVAGYPDANARRSGALMVAATASGPGVGDLPEGTATLLQIASP